MLQEHHRKEPAVITVLTRETSYNWHAPTWEVELALCDLQNSFTQPRPYFRGYWCVPFLLIFQHCRPGVQHIDLSITFVDNVYCPVWIMADGQENLCKKITMIPCKNSTTCLSFKSICLAFEICNNNISKILRCLAFKICSALYCCFSSSTTELIL